MELLTTSEAAKKCGISRKCVSLLCAEGRIEGVILKGKRAASMPAVNFETVEDYLYMEKNVSGMILPSFMRLKILTSSCRYFSYRRWSRMLSAMG